MAKRREKTRRQQKKKPTAQHAITLQKQAFQNIRTPNFPKHRRKALFRNTNISKLLTGQKSGRKSRTAQNAIKLQKQAFPRRSKHKILQNAEKRHFFNTQIFSNWSMRTTLAQCEPQKTLFLSGQHPVKEVSRPSAPCTNSGVCFYKTELLAQGGEFVTFGLFCCCHTFPLKCLFL